MKRNYLLILIMNFAIIGLFAQVKEVTVFADRALVTRSLIQDGNPGENKIIFSNIPPGSDPDSIRARGFVTAGSGLKILDIRLVKNYGKIATDQDKKGLQTLIKDKKERTLILKSNLDRIGQEKKILEIFNIKLTNETKDDIENGKLNVKQWQDAVKYHNDELEKYDMQYFEITGEISKISDELAVLEDKYKKYQSNDSAYTMDAQVTYSLKSKGNVEILLSYIVPGTYWYPVYDSRLDLKTGLLSLEYHAKVKQNTGEDWNDVNLTLSTARPGLSGVIPVLNPWELDLYEYDNKPKTTTYYGKKESEELSMSSVEDSKGASNRDRAEDYNAGIKSYGLSISYIIPQKVVIPSGTEETKVTISTGISLKPDLSWSIVPRMDSSSFLNGKIKNTSDFTLLPGEINLFVDDSFIGKSNIEMINPSQEFSLSLGRDPRISAEFKLENVNKGTKFGRKFEQRKYKITISNNSNEDAVINVKDIIPKSVQVRKINIKIVSIVPQPTNVDNESVCSWDMTINKNSKAIITEEWYVDYPDSQFIQGLN